MNMDKKISVIVPVYNVEKQLDRCIASIVNQTYANLQIILIDDGSTDDCGIICDKWACQDSRISVIHQKNAGVGNARNTGLDFAQGEYVAFVDADDYICSEMYSILTDSAERTCADQACCCVNNVYSTSTKEEKHAFGDDVLSGPATIQSELIISLLNPEQANGKATLLQPLWNKLYSRNLIEQNGIRFDAELTYAEDWLFNVNFYRHAKCVAFVPDCLYYYDRTTEGSLSKKFRWDGFDQSVKIRNYEKEWFPEYCTDAVYHDLILNIEAHYMRLYAARNGLAGFTKYARHLFDNETLKNVYLSIENKQKSYRLLKKSFESHNVYTYILWGLLRVLVSAIKYYIKKIIRRI